MKLAYTNTALDALQDIPAAIRKAFYKQVGFLLGDLHHPSLHAKKYSETKDKWQARVNKSRRFYFKIVGDTYLIEDRDDTRFALLPDLLRALRTTGMQGFADGLSLDRASRPECAAAFSGDAVCRLRALLAVAAVDGDHDNL
jgi:mRNA-degrading endonuclease RelE of RelBE toxin-antitoxin system